MSITIYVRSISNKLFEILIDHNASIHELKTKLSSQVKITKEHLLILFHNQLCAEDDATLLEYDIYDKDILTFEVKKISDPIKTFDDDTLKISYTHRNIIKKI
jgi:hypothetical protein